MISIEHQRIRHLLQSLGSTYQYQESLTQDWDHEPVRETTVRTAREVGPRTASVKVLTVSEPRPANQPSALEFALRGFTPAPERAPALPPSPVVPRPLTPPLAPVATVAVAPAVRAPAALSAAVLAPADPQRSAWSRLTVPSAAMSSAVQTPPPSDWRPQEPPSLEGIDEVIVNFATDGLDWAYGHRPVGVTVSTLDGLMVRFLPFAFKGGGNLDEATVKRWAQRELRGKKITNANTRSDMHQSRVWGVDLEEQGNTFSDIMHTAALLDDHRKRFRLDLLVEDYLPDQVIVPRLDERRHSDYEASEVAAREIFTASVVGRLRDVMYPQIDQQDLRRVQDLEDTVIPCVVEMEKNGAPIDMELLDQFHKECHAQHDALMWEIARETSLAFETTPKGWRRLLEYYHLPIPDSFAEAELNAIDHPMVRKAQRAAQYASLNSKIFDAYKTMIRSDGILHFELNQLRMEDEKGVGRGTVSGRFSAGFIQQVPNYGNHFSAFGHELYPRRLYKPGSGQYLAADAAQIQYRIFAHLANNARIMKMYDDDPKASFHRMIEGLIRPHKPDLIYEHLKNMNFMKIFGGGLAKLALMMGHITPRDLKEIMAIPANQDRWKDPRLARAREVQQIYDREIPEIGPLLAKAAHLAMSECDTRCNTSDVSRKLHKEFPHRGFVRTILGRRSRFPNNYKLHKAFCMIDQGSEGDIMKTKIVELHKERKHTGFLMRQTVHDEVSGDATEPDTLTKVNEILNQQSFPQLRVPILFECKVGATWADCK